MKEYFRLEEAISSPRKYILMPNHENISKFFNGQIKGSFSVLPARLLDLSYPDYLRFCRDVLGAELVGKKSIYPFCYFQKTESVQMFLRLLNKRMAYLENEYDDRYEYIENNGKVEKIPFEEM